jgi:23S rRNA pseudouridine1911/1915/1917 synthase
MRNISSCIIFEDRDVIVINKPAGLLTSTVPRERRVTAIALLRDHVAKREPRARVGVVHRLDRDASGLLVFSKNHEAYRALKHQFFHHTVSRVYAALVHGKPNPPRGKIQSRLVEHPDGSVHSTKRPPPHGQRAMTEYEVVEHRTGKSLLKVTLHTGRKHQIRAHLSERGCPIVGDQMYGKPRDESPKLMLTASELEFDHPRSGKRVRFTLEPAFASEQVKHGHDQSQHQNRRNPESGF